jgi:hypothetical protein
MEVGVVHSGTIDGEYSDSSGIFRGETIIGVDSCVDRLTCGLISQYLGEQHWTG